MEKAANRIRKAIESFERIAVFGDYDADGVTSAAVMYSYLEVAVPMLFATFPTE